LAASGSPLHSFVFAACICLSCLQSLSSVSIPQIGDSNLMLVRARNLGSVVILRRHCSAYAESFRRTVCKVLARPFNFTNRRLSLPGILYVLRKIKCGSEITLLCEAHSDVFQDTGAIKALLNADFHFTPTSLLRGKAPHLSCSPKLPQEAE